LQHVTLCNFVRQRVTVCSDVDMCIKFRILTKLPKIVSVTILRSNLIQSNALIRFPVNVEIHRQIHSFVLSYWMNSRV